MNEKKIKKELKQFEKELIDAINWYEAKAIEVLRDELYKYLKDFFVFNASFHYYIPHDGWTKDFVFNDCQKSAGELIELLIESHIEHGGDWAFYIEDGTGDPRYFIQYNGYEFYYGYIGDE